MNMRFKATALHFHDPVAAMARLDRIERDRSMQIHRISMASRRIADDYPDLAAWFCLRIMTGKERAVEKYLSEANVEVILPMTEASEMKRRGRLVTIPSRPLMPGYLFARCVVSPGAMSGLAGTEHVLGLVGSAGRPMKISAESIKRFMAKAPTNEPQPDAGEYREGISVIVTDGPLEGFMGIIGKLAGNGRKARDDGKSVPVALSHPGGVARMVLPLAMLSIL